MTDEQLVEAYLEGLTYREIAARYGVSLSTVGNRLTALRRAGVRLPPRLGRDPDVERLNALVREREGR